MGVLPDSGDVRVLEREVEDGGKVGEGALSKMLEVITSHTIRAHRPRVFLPLHRLCHLVKSERDKGMIDAPATNLTQKTTSRWRRRKRVGVGRSRR